MTTLVERHFSAFGAELKKYYQFQPGFLFLDLTLGDGGHTQTALESGCRVVSFDMDSQAIQRATGFITGFTPIIIPEDNLDQTIPPDFNWLIINSNFTKVAEVCQKLSLPKFDGLMVDLGPSQFQVLAEGRGFSFATDEPLDMRIDRRLGVTAADLLAVLNEGELRELFSLADEAFAKPLARIIVQQRQISPIFTTKQLSDLVTKVKHGRSGGNHPATQTFMALRMAVNLERENIKLLLPQLPGLLKKGGRLGLISFHSGEDKLVKDFFTEQEKVGVLSAINQKPITPSSDELKISLRTRSAKIRLAIKNI